MHHADEDNPIKEIVFPSGNRAKAVFPPTEADADEILRALDIKQPKALIMMIGGAALLDEALKPRLTQLFSRGIARAAVRTDAMIIDGGTQVGTMALMGQGVADRGSKSILLGIAPAGKVTYPEGPPEGSIENGAPLDPHHSHFVLPESNEWGEEISCKFQVAAALARGTPVITVLANGGVLAKQEVLQSVRRGWPVIVMEGSGRLADEVATLLQKKPDFIEDPVMSEIIADGDVRLFPLHSPVGDLGQQITEYFETARRLTGDPALRMAWERFAVYDMNATSHQAGSTKLQFWILTLGVLGTLLALSLETLRSKGLPKWSPEINQDSLVNALHFIIVLIPITVAVLVAAANRFKSGNKWILLRAGGEAIKREIFRYRAGVEITGNEQTRLASREARLTQRVESISRQLMQTEVNLSPLLPYEGPIPPKMYGAAEGDDGLSLLEPDRYLAIRIGDQLNYYKSKTNKLGAKLQGLQWLIYIVGGVGTLLAAFGFELWIALTTTIAAAFTTYLAYQQVEDTLMQYNQASTDLTNLEGWWSTLSPEQKAEPTNVERLVGHTERILQGQLTGWVQGMQDSLVQLRAQQTGKRSGAQET